MTKLIKCKKCNGAGQVFALRGFYDCGYCSGRGYGTKKDLDALSKWMTECNKLPWGTPRKDLPPKLEIEKR